MIFAGLTFIDPRWWDVALPAALLLLVAAMTGRLIANRLFRRRLENAAKSGVDALVAFGRRYSSRALLRHSRIVERIAETSSERRTLPHKIGITRLWVERLGRRQRSSDYRRVLAFGRGEDLWPCFLVALAHPGRADRFLKWFIGKDSQVSMREMARAGGGQEFDGRRAAELLRESIDRIREMTGDPDWRVRHFAANIIIHDASMLSHRALWDMFRDGAFAIRKKIVEGFTAPPPHRLYDALYDRVLHDSVYTVRRAARLRIQREFADRYRPDPDSLASHEALHVLDLLAPGSDADRNLACGALGQDKIELRAVAARYLSQEGVLRRLLESVDLGDRKAFDHTLTLLRAAAEVDVTDFLYVIRDGRDGVRGNITPGTLLLSLRLLATHGPRSLIRDIAERALRGTKESEHRKELREAAFECIEKRGDDAALLLLFEEILAQRADDEEAALMLRHVPKRGEELFTDTALRLICDTEFGRRRELIDVIARFPDHLIVPKLISIVQDVDREHAGIVRRDALLALTRMSLPYLLDFMLEHLYLLDAESGRGLAENLSKTSGEKFDAAVSRLLSNDDTSVRSAIILALPGTGRKTFVSQIRDAVGDADPAVRCAAIESLVLFDDVRSLRNAISRLRDPMEEVRIAAASAISRAGSDSMIEELGAIIDDESEVESVKRAAIAGLGASDREVALDLAVASLSKHDELETLIIDALSSRTDLRRIRYLIETLKDGDERLRGQLSTAFHKMGSAAEEPLLGLLREQIESLRPCVAGVLEDLGVVEAQIRRLGHRDPAVRRSAASILALIETRAAFRGIVRAARDPDEEVRVQVVKAIERLGTEDGRTMLRALETDPESRVRKYTHWAVERLKSRAI